MPAAVVAAPWFVPALLGTASAAAGVGGAALQSRSANKATKAQQQANNEAIAYQREQEAKRAASNQSRLDQARKSMDAWYARVGDEGIKRYGVPSWWTPPSKTPIGKAVAFDAPAAGAMAPKPPAIPAAAPLMATRQSLATLTNKAPLAPSPTPMAPVSMAPTPLTPAETRMRPQNLSDLAGWSNWERYTR